MDVVLLSLRFLTTVLLYIFLAAVLIILWRDLRRVSGAREPAHRAGRLVVLPTADQILAVSTAFPLLPITSIGRAPGNSIALADDFASSEHALLTWREGQWWLEDLGSRNGTLLNSTPVRQPTVLSTGDIIALGRTQLKLEFES